MDYRAMFDRDHIGAWDLAGGDATVTIREVKAGELTGQGGRKAKKPLVFFEGKEKSLALNRTNGKVIATMYGTDTRAWVGKKITIFPTQTQFGGDTVDCIRVRPQIPRGGSKPKGALPPAPNGRDPNDPDNHPDPGPPEDREDIE